MVKEHQGAREGRRRAAEVGSAARLIVQPSGMLKAVLKKLYELRESRSRRRSLTLGHKNGLKVSLRGSFPERLLTSVGPTCIKTGDPGEAPAHAAERRLGSWTNLDKIGKRRGGGLKQRKRIPHCHPIASQYWSCRRRSGLHSPERLLSRL